MMAGLDHTRKMMLKIVLSKLTCSYLELLVRTNKKKQCGSVDVRSWLDPCKSYQTRLGDDSESEGRPALVRAAQLSSPLLYWKDIAVQLGKTLPAVQLCTSLVQFSAKISSPLLHEDPAVQNFVLCTTLV